MTPGNDSADARFAAKDPLGVIQKAATQLWMDRGAPPGTTWHDFFAEAEELLLAGRGSTAAVAPGNEHRLSTPETLPPEIWALRDQDYDPFAAAVACGVTKLFDTHEAFCFATLLSSNEFKLVGGEYRICGDEEIVAFLAALGGEYDEDFLKREGRGNLAAIANEARSEYWRSKLAEWRKEDRPLNFHDRNTTERLRDAISSHPVIEAVRLKEPNK